MRIGGLGACLILSALLNLVGFAPLMNFLLGRGGTTRPSPRPPIQVRLLNAHMEPPRQQSPIVPPKPDEKIPPPPVPKEKPKVAALPKDLKPVKTDLPEEVTPQARPQAKAQPKAAARPAQATPAGPLTRPDEKSNAMLPPPGTGNAAPFSAPGNATTPIPGDGPPGEGPPGEATPTPAPSSSPSPLAENTNPQPSQPPVGPGTNPSEGAIPEKPASPTTFPPQQNSRTVLRKLGGKSLIRVGLKIHPDGHIDTQIVLSSGNAELDAAVLKDLKDWKWNPAEVGGKPVLSERVIKLKLEAD